MIFKFKAFKWRDLGNGFYEVLNVETFPTTKRIEKMPSGKVKVYNFTREWLEHAVALAKRNHQENDGYLPPIHIGHNEKDELEQPNAGFFYPHSVAERMVDGKLTPVIISNFIVPDDIKIGMQKGKFPYRSIEVDDFESGEITSLALLTSRKPWMMSKPLVLGKQVKGRSKLISPILFKADFKGFNKFRFVSRNTPYISPVAPMKKQKFKHSFSKDTLEVAKKLNFSSPEELKFIDKVLFGGPGSGRYPKGTGRKDDPRNSSGGYGDTLNRRRGEDISGTAIERFGKALQNIDISDFAPANIGGKLLKSMAALVGADPDSSWENKMRKAGKFSCDQEDSLDFGAKESVSALASKIAKNWGSTKAKILSSPKYRKLIEGFTKDLEAGNSPAGGWLAPENLVSYMNTVLTKLPTQELSQLSDFLFSETDNKMGNEKLNFGVLDKLKSIVKNRPDENLSPEKLKAWEEISRDPMIKKMMRKLASLEKSGQLSQEEVNSIIDNLPRGINAQLAKLGKAVGGVFSDDDGEEDSENLSFTKPMDPLSRGKSKLAKLRQIEAQIPELEALIEKYKSQETDKSFPADLPAAKKRLTRRKSRAESLQAELKELRRYVRKLKGQGRGSVGFSAEDGEEDKSMNFDDADQISSKIRGLRAELDSMDFADGDGVDPNDLALDEDEELEFSDDEMEEDEEDFGFMDEDENMEEDEEELEFSDGEEVEEEETEEEMSFSDEDLQGDDEGEENSGKIDKLLEMVEKLIRLQTKDDGAEPSPQQFSSQKASRSQAKAKNKNPEDSSDEKEIIEMSAERITLKEREAMNKSLKFAARELKERSIPKEDLKKAVKFHFKRGGEKQVRDFVQSTKMLDKSNVPGDVKERVFKAMGDRESDVALKFKNKHPKHSLKIDKLCRSYEELCQNDPSYKERYSEEDFLDNNLVGVVNK